MSRPPGEYHLGYTRILISRCDVHVGNVVHISLLIQLPAERAWVSLYHHSIVLEFARHWIERARETRQVPGGHPHSESILLILWLEESITLTRCRDDVVEQVRSSVTACCGKRVQGDFAAWSCAPYQETKTLDIKEIQLIDVDVGRSQGRQVAEVPTKPISFCIALRNQLRKARAGHVVGFAEAVQ